MIDISLYSKFQNDLKTNYLNIHAFIVIGWDRNDTTRHQFGSPNEDSIFLSEKKELFDGDYYDDVDIIDHLHFYQTTDIMYYLLN